MKRIKYTEAELSGWHSLCGGDAWELMNMTPMIEWCKEHRSPGQFSYAWKPTGKDTFWFERIEDAVYFRLMFSEFEPVA